MNIRNILKVFFAVFLCIAFSKPINKENKRNLSNPNLRNSRRFNYSHSKSSGNRPKFGDRKSQNFCTCKDCRLEHGKPKGKNGSVYGKPKGKIQGNPHRK